LGNNDIGDAGATDLANALSSNANTSINEIWFTHLYPALLSLSLPLSLSYNRIGDEGATKLAESLEKNPSLTKIMYVYNRSAFLSLAPRSG
jgi:hypothetical protein